RQPPSPTRGEGERQGIRLAVPPRPPRDFFLSKEKTDARSAGLKPISDEKPRFYERSTCVRNDLKNPSDFPRKNSAAEILEIRRNCHRGDGLSP
ncbi:MAG TPA: hypothetical protein VIM02_11585, partial [Rhizomicrobium sp.]